MNTTVPSLISLYRSSHLYTIILFTWTDYKTIFLPVTSFATATAPIHSLPNLLQVCAWIWLHLILCNVSNQALAREEDAINRPWRPLPSGRVTASQALQFRWLMVLLCLLWSSTYGKDLVAVTLCLVAITILYDEVGLSNHPLGKNICNVGGYASFEVGATKIMGLHKDLDRTSKVAIVISAMMILTTIQAQDFPDVEGDVVSKRVTFPIYAPEFSRVFTLLIVPMWSVLLVWFWNIGWSTGVIYIGLGSYVGARYYRNRSQRADKNSYVIFNIWLTFSHILPLHARTGFLCF